MKAVVITHAWCLYMDSFKLHEAGNIMRGESPSVYCRGSDCSHYVKLCSCGAAVPLTLGPRAEKEPIHRQMKLVG